MAAHSSRRDGTSKFALPPKSARPALMPGSQVVSRNPRAHLPPCRYEGRSLTFSPSSGLGNSLLAFASFAALANLTRRRLAVHWAHGTNPSAQAGFDELFAPPPTSMAHTFVDSHMVHVPTCNPAPQSRCFINARAQNWDAVQRLRAAPGFEGEPWVACSAVLGVGNAYFVPMMEAIHSSPLEFGPFSRLMLVPKPDAVRRADRFVSEQTTSGTAALIALHVRQSLISGRANRSTGKFDSRLADPWPSSSRFMRCLADVRARAREAGYASSRIYVAADQVSVRERARQLLGDSVVPAHCGGRCTLPNDTGLAPQRTTADVRAALSELLVLARADALLVWNLRYSTYSAVGATWAAHRAAGQPLARSRYWLGVWCVQCGCKRIRDEDVQPAMWGPLGNTTLLRRSPATPQRSSACEQQHVALLSVGQRRTVELPEVAASVRRLRSSLLAEGHLVTTLLFISCTAAERAGLRSRLLKMYDASEAWLSSEELTPCLSACKSVSCNGSSILGASWRFLHETNSLMQWFRQFGKVRAAWQRALEYELQGDRRRFTWFLKIRPDLIFFEPLPSLCLLNARFKHSALVPRGVMTSDAKYQLHNDHVILCPRSLCAPYFAVVSQYEACGRTGALLGFSPDVPQTSYVRAFHAQFGRGSLGLFDLAYTLARSSGPECIRLECNRKTPYATGCIAPHLPRFVTACREIAKRWRRGVLRHDGNTTSQHHFA